VKGAGTDIWGATDGFHFDWQTLSGDGSVSAHVTSQTNTSPYAKAGVMLRLSTSASAPFYDVIVQPGQRIEVEYRANQGGTAVMAAAVAGAAPVYLKATRSGSTYSAYSSSDGINWMLIPGSTVTVSGLSGTLLTGLAVTSHQSGVLSTVTFNP
jgi:hypothetical protein